MNLAALAADDKLRCPNCAQGMHAHTLPALYGKTVTVDACYDCHALWFDESESLQLSADGVIELFRLVHDQHVASSPKISEGLACVRCKRTLQVTHDRVGNNRFNYQRCREGHGRLITFYQFLAEKRFVRELTPAERHRLAAEVKQVRCSGCGAAVNLATQSACEYCRAPISVFDREAAKKAIEHYLHERGKQVPSSPQVVVIPGHDRRADGWLTAADLAMDAVWAMTYFARRPSAAWLPTGAVLSDTAGAAIPEAVDLTSAALPSASEALVSDASDLLPTADELLNSGASGASGLFTTVFNDSTEAARALTDATAEGAGTLFETATDAGSGLIDLVSDGFGALAENIFG